MIYTKTVCRLPDSIRCHHLSNCVGQRTYSCSLLMLNKCKYEFDVVLTVHLC